MKEILHSIEKLVNHGVLIDGAVAFRKRSKTFMTRRGCDWKNLTESDFIILEDVYFSEIEKLPQEYFLCLAIFDVFPKVNVILRTKSEAVWKASVAQKALKAFSVPMAQAVGSTLRSIDESVWENPQEIVQATSFLKGSSALLIQNHGLLCVGRSFKEVEKCAVALEEGCATLLNEEHLPQTKSLHPLRCWYLRKKYHYQQFKTYRKDGKQSTK